MYTWIFETAQIIAFSGKNAVTASFSKDGVFCCDEAHAGRKQKETASLSVQTASLGVQTASFPVHGFCTTHKTAFFFDYGVFSLKNASGKNLCRLKIQAYTEGPALYFNMLEHYNNGSTQTLRSQPDWSLKT